MSFFQIYIFGTHAVNQWFDYRLKINTRVFPTFSQKGRGQYTRKLYIGVDMNACIYGKHCSVFFHERRGVLHQPQLNCWSMDSYGQHQIDQHRSALQELYEDPCFTLASYAENVSMAWYHELCMILYLHPWHISIINWGIIGKMWNLGCD